MKELTLDLQNYDPSGTIFRRTAVRGIICRENNYLLIYSDKYGDVKFPGGGMEPGESLECTLIREVREESGYDVLLETIKPYMIIHERRKGLIDPVLFMDSYYYQCKVGDTIHEQQLEGYEIDENYQVVWRTLEDAIRQNQKILAHTELPWVTRELRVMQELAKQEQI